VKLPDILIPEKKPLNLQKKRANATMLKYSSTVKMEKSKTRRVWEETYPDNRTIIPNWN
jgi:hypothetical protein